MSSPVVPASRSRPVVVPAIDALAARADELARAWAAALVRARPLERIGDVPLEEIARGGPDLCAAILSAVQSDEAMATIARRGGDERGPASLVTIAAAGGPDELAADVEALRGVIWERLEPALAQAPGRTLAEAGDRLAAACAAALGAGLAGRPPNVAPVREDPLQPPSEPAVLGGRRDGPAVIVDEALPVGGGVGRAREEDWPATPEPDGEEIVIHAAPPREGAAAWMRTIGGQLDRHLRDGLPFGVLLAEVVSPGDPAQAARVSPALERVLESEARAAGSGASVVRQGRGRWWLLVPGLDRQAAEQLGGRLSGAVQSIRTPEGASVMLAVGSASCPQDGADAAALAAHADVGLYAARAARRRRRGVSERA